MAHRLARPPFPLALWTARLTSRPSDKTIIPWFSALFGQYANSTVAPPVALQNQTFYRDDSFGLRTLDERGRLTLTEVPGVAHDDWVRDEGVFAKYVLPFLD